MNLPIKLPRRSFFAMLPALLTACSGVDLLNATVPTDTYRRTEGLSYGGHPRAAGGVFLRRELVVGRAG
ncbi:MAG: hypothetical protein Q8R06_10340 [Polaromonas sp.]|uniref:hypothetical protein n=1 Tax=Polaromonas sp. TaxID=1869339 RepID=UPI0027360B10|nr:hypothetical protein [Polaromonas sp.]MDP3797532.1 hypothetical protein [Polaromonas sp.]